MGKILNEKMWIIFFENQVLMHSDSKALVLSPGPFSLSIVAIGFF
jgi:hypothetical protein